MELNVEQIGDVSVVTFKAEALDASNYNDFKASVAPILADHAKVVLDISRMKVVDSSGLGAILSCMRKVKAAGGDLKLLCGMSRPVRMFFELVRIHRIIDIFATVQEAVASFAVRGDD